MIAHLKELYRYRELLRIWTLREIKIRYKQSILGAAWAILQPLVLMLIFTVVFSVLVKVPSQGFPYPVFSYTAVLPWTFFHAAISFGTPSLLTNMNLVTRTYFPREILPLGAIGASFLDFLVASSIFAVMLLAYRIPLTGAVVWLPLVLAIQVALTLGVTFLGSSLSVHFRDIRFLVPLGLQLWFYATPVIYPLSMVPERFRSLYMLNPMAGIIDSYRMILLHGQIPDAGYLTRSSVVVLAVLVVGYLVFKRLEVSFADII